MAETGAADQIKLKVFISYSRRDEEFAQELLAGLELAGFDPYLDKNDIAAGEDWEARLGRLIEAADTVVFVISPDSVASERCSWEVERTVDLKKRLLPIVWRGVEEAHVPPHLKQLNYIFFDRPHSFGPSLVALATALKTDIGWIREHTRIGEAAIRWDALKRAEALLFRSEELAAAVHWLKDQPQYAPEPTLLHLAFIKASEDAEVARNNAERQRLDQVAAAQAEREQAVEREKAALVQTRAALRKRQRALAGAGVLFACLFVGAIGWSNQEWIKETYIVYRSVRPHVLSAREEAALKPLGPSFRECADTCPEMVVVPPGSFMMGSPETDKDRVKDEGPQHKITIAKPFAVSKFEVTFAEWDLCVWLGGCRNPASDAGWGRARRPVVNVSWDDAQEYVAWLSRLTGKPYRLLTEAEWEYAARAGTTTVYSWGDDFGEGNANCNWCGNARTAPVGSYKPNAFGLHDMEGNALEWVQDCFDNYKNTPTDGSAHGEVKALCPRVLRGGSWTHNPFHLRVAARYNTVPYTRINNIGFRLARTLLHNP